MIAIFMNMVYYMDIWSLKTSLENDDSSKHNSSLSSMALFYHNQPGIFPSKTGTWSLLQYQATNHRSDRQYLFLRIQTYVHPLKPSWFYPVTSEYSS